MVMEAEGGLQIQKVVVKVMKTSGGLPAWKLDVELTTINHKTCYVILQVLMEVILWSILRRPRYMIIQQRMVEWQVNDELAVMWKEVVGAWSYYPGIFLHSLIQDSRFLGKYSKQAPAKHKGYTRPLGAVLITRIIAFCTMTPCGLVKNIRHKYASSTSCVCLPFVMCFLMVGTFGSSDPPAYGPTQCLNYSWMIRSFLRKWSRIGMRLTLCTDPFFRN
jgi:hypothetical protein